MPLQIYNRLKWQQVIWIDKSAKFSTSGLTIEVQQSRCLRKYSKNLLLRLEFLEFIESDNVTILQHY